jgi:hypothetical protein
MSPTKRPQSEEITAALAVLDEGPITWEEILDEFARADVPISRGTYHNWRHGREPRFGEGQVLVRLAAKVKRRRTE